MNKNIKNIQAKFSQAGQRGQTFFKKHSLKLVGALLLLLFVILVVARATQKAPEIPAAPEVSSQEVKAVEFGAGALSEKAIGTVKNLSSITLVAQSNGPVSAVKVTEGQTVKKGQVLLQQSTTYNTGTVQSVQRQVASKSYELSKESLKSTTEVVAKTREQADLNRNNTEELRKMTEKSIDDTKSLITTTEQVVAKIESDIAAEQAGANNASTIQGYRQSLIQYKGVLNNNRAALRGAEYEVNKDNPPTKMADISRDLIYKTTEIQLKSAQINQDIAFLNLKMAQINEAATRVTAPFAGTVEKIFAQPGQQLNPGAPAIKLKGEANLTLQIAVAGEVAQVIDETRMTQVRLGEREFELPIAHVSSTPINGQTYEVMVSIPAEYQQFVQEEAAVNVVLPLYATTISEGNYFLPLDAVFVTNTSRYVLVAKDGKAARREIETGEIIGGSIEIKSGLIPGDIVIMDRRVIEGQLVTPKIQSTVNPIVQELG